MVTLFISQDLCWWPKPVGKAAGSGQEACCLLDLQLFYPRVLIFLAEKSLLVCIFIVQTLHPM